MSGSRSTARLRNATTPNTTAARAKMKTVTGRRIEKSTSRMLNRDGRTDAGARLENVDRRSVGEAVLTEDDDVLAGLEPGHHLDMIAFVVAEPHLAPARHVALLDVDGVADRLQHQRGLRNDQRVVVPIGLEEDAGEHAGAQAAVGLDLERGLHRSGGAVDHRAHAQHPRVEALTGERFDREVRALAHLEPAEVLLRHLDRALQRIERRDAEQRSRALHVLGELDEAGHDHPGEGRPDRGVVELHLGLVHLGARRFELRRRLIEQRAREDLLLVLRLGPLISELGLALVDLGELEAGADLGVVDARQQLARLDLHTLLDRELDDRARRPRHQRHVVVGLDGAVGLEELSDRPPLDRHHADRNGGRSPCARRATRARRRRRARDRWRLPEAPRGSVSARPPSVNRETTAAQERGQQSARAMRLGSKDQVAALATRFANRIRSSISEYSVGMIIRVRNVEVVMPPSITSPIGAQNAARPSICPNTLGSRNGSRHRQQAEHGATSRS